MTRDVVAGVDAVAVGEQREAVRPRRVAASTLLAWIAAALARRSGRRSTSHDAPGRGAACRRAGGGIALGGGGRDLGSERSRRGPSSASSAGRANSSKLTSDDTGLPGSPNTGVPRTIAERERLRRLDRDLAPLDALPRTVGASRSSTAFTKS